MSLGINTTTPEGIVLAADSRQSYRNRKGMSRIGSDSASKVFKIGDKMGVIVAAVAQKKLVTAKRNIVAIIKTRVEAIRASGAYKSAPTP